VTVNALSAAGFLEGSMFTAAALQTFNREAPKLLSWPLLTAVSLPALPYLLWKSTDGTVDDRSRVTFLALGIVGALAPMGLAVVLAPFIPALARPVVQDWFGAGLYLALASVLPLTTYAVAAQRVLDVQLVIRRAVQHALARQVVWAVIIGSVAYVAVSLYAGRHRPLAELWSDHFGLVSLAAFGIGALTFRAQLLAGVDRWFERGAADCSAVLTRLASEMGGQRNLRDLQATLKQELGRALQAAHVAILVVNDDGSAFVSLEGNAPPLPVSSAIVGMFRSTREELCLRGDSADPVARLLLRQDKGWLAEVNVEWVFPLFDSSESLLGLVCLGEGRGPAYSKRDRVLVSAMADQLALRMENLSLRRWPANGEADSFGRGVAPVDWLNERAMQCPACRCVAPANTTTCVCGSRLQPASVPLVLNGKFRVERMLGAGGMGVVYLALDTTFGRRVAVKTMPAVTPRHVARLQREARAMASVRHPNLAMIYGAERWRDVPLLVVEYLEGGTLSDSLRTAPLSLDEVLDLGIVLADALDRMHAGGLLHRDIKPSNIGYSGDGIVKLLDFGLAAMLDSVNEDAGHHVPRALEPRALASLLEAYPPTATVSLTQHLVGTPLYLSPEVIAGEEPDQACDLWSLALALFEALSGRHPLAGYPTVEAMRRIRSVRLPDVRDSRSDCPAPLAAFLNDALALQRERRPQTAADFRMQLQLIRQTLTASPHRLALRSLY
jgi:hypothetical protein